MNKFLETDNISKCHKDLVNKYEKLRSDVLNQSQSSFNHPPGLSILILRGTATWMETYLSSRLFQTGTETTNDHHTLKSNEPFFPAHEEAVTILTHMILSYQKELLRSNYA